jgi:hypothetical protein
MFYPYSYTVVLSKAAYRKIKPAYAGLIQIDLSRENAWCAVQKRGNETRYT